MVQPISEIVNNEDGMGPVIVHFQNSELQKGEENKLSAGIYQKSSNKAVVAISAKNILYTGEINKNEDNDDLYNRFLLISNRRTGKVRMVAVDTVMVTPKFASKVQKNDSLDKSAEDWNNSVTQLNREFGSKKIKRLTEQRERLKMNIDDVKEQLEETVARVQLDESTSYMVDPVENESLYKPPIHRDALAKEEVYILDDLVPEDVLDSLQEEAMKVLSSDLDELELSPFIKEKFSQMQDSSSSDINKAKILLYTDYLIKFVSRPVKNLTKKIVICPSSSEVNNHILDNFSVLTGNTRTRPLSMKDKTVCYILVLGMIATDYELNIEALSKCIKTGVKKLQEMGRILAFSAGKNKSIMTLRLPLPPAVSLHPKKRKR